MKKCPNNSRRLALRTIAAATACASFAAVVAPAGALEIGNSAIPERTQITIINNDGRVSETARAHEPGPAESLAKLLLGYWVLQHGDQAAKAQVPTMIAYSDDYLATLLDGQYQNAISEAIAYFGLQETKFHEYWGDVTTSPHDMAVLGTRLLNDPVAAPMVNAMKFASLQASDGYRQDYGASRLPGVWATKFGWADNGTVNNTLSFGPDYVISTRTYGTADDSSYDVQLLGNSNPTPPTPRVAFGSSEVPAMDAKELYYRSYCGTPSWFLRLLPSNGLIPLFIARLLPQCR